MNTDFTTGQLVELFSQVSQSTKSIFDLASRTDERVKVLIEKQQDIDTKIDRVIESQNSLLFRLSVVEKSAMSIDDLNKRIRMLETDVHELKIHSQGSITKWKSIIDVTLKIISLVAGAWIIWHLGIR